MAEKASVRLFVDFWNLQLNWNDYHAGSGRAGNSANSVEGPARNPYTVGFKRTACPLYRNTRIRLY